MRLCEAFNFPMYHNKLPCLVSMHGRRASTGPIGAETNVEQLVWRLPRNSNWRARLEDLTPFVKQIYRNQLFHRALLGRDPEPIC
jgi:hypothetical protein